MTRDVLADQLLDDAAPFAVVLGGLLVGLLLQRFVLPRLAKLAQRSRWTFDDELVAAIKWPLVLWTFLAGARIALRMVTLAPRDESLLGMAILVVWILSVTWACARFAAAAVISSVARNGLTGASLLATIARVTVFIIGVLVVLQTIGIRIEPILATLGVGGLAVGLALQDTLANIFAGIRILLARKIRPGDPVRLEQGHEGTIQDIGWGQTTINQKNGNLVIVPNSKLATSITTRLAPVAESPATFSVAHGSDLEKVEKLAMQAAEETLSSVPEADADFKPNVRFTEFRDVGVKVTVALRPRPGRDAAPVVSDYIRRVYRKLHEAGIRTPQPAAAPPSQGPA